MIYVYGFGISVLLVIFVFFGLAMFEWTRHFIKEYKKESKPNFSLDDLKSEFTIGSQIKINFDKIPTYEINNIKETIIVNEDEFLVNQLQNVLMFFQVAGWSDDILFIRMLKDKGINIINSTSSNPAEVYFHPIKFVGVEGGYGSENKEDADKVKVMDTKSILLKAGNKLTIIGENAEIDVNITDFRRTGPDAGQAKIPNRIIQASDEVFSIKITESFLDVIKNNYDIVNSARIKHYKRQLNNIKTKVIELENHYLSEMESVLTQYEKELN